MKALSFGNRIAKFGNVCISAGVVNPTYHVNLIESISGTVNADPMKGRQGTIVTLSNEPAEGYAFDSYSITGAELTGNTFAIQNSDVSVEGVWGYDAFPITYESDEHVSITGDNLYIPGSTGITLQTGYDTYYRISGYDVTGGYIENGILYPTGPCTARAIAMLNAFTASGGFEHGSNVTALARYGYNEGDATIGAKYATTSYHTSNVPTAWYNTSNRWKVTTNEASGYQITLNPKMTVTGNGNNAGSRYYFTACSLIGSTQTQSQSQNRTGNGSLVYSESFTSNSTGVNYGLSGHMHVWAARGDAYIGYVAADTTGTWIATGVLP